MKIEKIKKAKLLATLKGTDQDGKQVKWLRGTIFDKAIRPFPLTILRELPRKRNHPIFEILEVYPEVVPEVVPIPAVVPEVMPEPEVVPLPEVVPEVTAETEVKQEDPPKDVLPKKITRIKRQ